MAPRPSCTHGGRWEAQLWIVCRSVAVDWWCRILAILNQYARCVHFVHCTTVSLLNDLSSRRSKQVSGTSMKYDRWQHLIKVSVYTIYGVSILLPTVSIIHHFALHSPFYCHKYHQTKWSGIYIYSIPQSLFKSRQIIVLIKAE